MLYYDVSEAEFITILYKTPLQLHSGPSHILYSCQVYYAYRCDYIIIYHTTVTIYIQYIVFLILTRTAKFSTCECAIL